MACWREARFGVFRVRDGEAVPDPLRHRDRVRRPADVTRALEGRIAAVASAIAST